MLKRWYLRYVEKKCPDCLTPLHWYECPYAGCGYECIPCAEAQGHIRALRSSDQKGK